MNKRSIIFLSVLIVILVAIIACGVSYLYKGVSAARPVESIPSVSDEHAAVASDTRVVAEEPAKAEPVQTPEKVNVRKEEVPAPQKFTVKNCKTGKQNTLKQSEDNKLELLDEKGVSQWRLILSAAIVPPVVEVDFYSNSKIQFLLCEGTKLHLIDRLGREVTGFPVDIKAKVTNGPVAVEKAGKCYYRIETESGILFAAFDKGGVKVLSKMSN